VPEGLALALALVVLASTLGAAVVPGALCDRGGGGDRRRAAPCGGRRGQSQPRRRRVARTGADVGFLAALLLIAEGARREGLFDAVGALIARGSRGSAQRLLAFVFVVAAGVTAALGLDATAVLLTPVVFATAARMRTSPRPHVLRVRHLANLGLAAAAGLQSHEPAGLPRRRGGRLRASPR